MRKDFERRFVDSIHKPGSTLFTDQWESTPVFVNNPSYEKDGEWKATSSYSTKELAALHALTGEALRVHLAIEKRVRAERDQLDEAA